MKKLFAFFAASLIVLSASSGFCASKQAVWSGTKENDAILVIGHAE